MEHLLILHQALDLSNSFHAAVWVTALVSFFSCRRLDEISILSNTALNPRFHVLASSLVQFSTASDGTQSATFHIPWMKTTHEGGAQIILTTCPDDLVCPLHALFNHCNVINTDRPSGMSFFTYHSGLGVWTHMVKTTFLKFCDSIWKSAAGGWTSLAFLLYWHRMEEIIPLSTSQTYRKSHLDHLISIFEDLRTHHSIPPTFMNDIDSLD